jgi:hypothetical protein
MGYRPRGLIDIQQVIPEGVAPVKMLLGCWIFLFGSPPGFGCAELRRRGPGSASGPTAQRPEVLDVDAAGRMLLMAEK